MAVEADERARWNEGMGPDPDPASPDAVGTLSGVTREEDGVARPHGRCAHHPARVAIGRCDRCGEPVCLTCAVPVRGRVLGPGCVAEELGDPALTQPPEPDRVEVGSAIAIAGAVVALVATVGPWTRTGAGDRVFGAWVADLRWSMVAAIAAVLLLPAVWAFRRHGDRAMAVLAIALGAGVIAAAALAIAFPPTFQAASWGPWTAISGGVFTVVGGLVDIVAERHPTQGV
jgi:hypothetical protein